MRINVSVGAGLWHVEAPDGSTIRGTARLRLAIPGVLWSLAPWEVAEAAQGQRYGLRVLARSEGPQYPLIRCLWDGDGDANDLSEPQMRLF